MSDAPLSKRLKEARKAAGYSQKNLGIAAGMDEFSASSRMNHYETGRHAPDFPTLQRIAKILKVPTAYFYAETDELAKFIKLFSNTSKVGRAQVVAELENKYITKEK